MFLKNAEKIQEKYINNIFLKSNIHLLEGIHNKTLLYTIFLSEIILFYKIQL